MADITLINLNMLFIRYGEEIERERHVPLGCLYLTRALEDAGFEVDFRDYQLCDAQDPFCLDVFLEFAREPASIIGLSCMANLLPFTVLAAKALKQRYNNSKIVLGGVGSKGVEEILLRRFPWIDIIVRGEGERTGVEMVRALSAGHTLAGIAGLSFQADGRNVHNQERPRIRDLDTLPFPAFSKVNLSRYAGYGMMTSRGCPYPCTFCSVAPVWNLESYSRSPENIIAEMKFLKAEAGVDLFLFQDEFFMSGKRQVMDFCRFLSASGLHVEWKAFGRVNLIDEEMMRAMVESGCIELRFGVESGSDTILRLTRKGFTSQQVLEVIPKAIATFPRVDAFYIWGFPFETLEDFYESLFQMISLRMMGARILPSLLSLLPQTQLYQELVNKDELTFCSYLLPEFVFTGHEICHGSEIIIPDQYSHYFRLIEDNPDIFPGFFHCDLEENIVPKLKLLQQFGFYPETFEPYSIDSHESCGAHSPKASAQEFASRV
ncbi:MAG: radical SAM protein [Chitinivibrionales bacterium]|nr:radical SAM protein [Chitinivibrionales bacterium]